MWLDLLQGEAIRATTVSDTAWDELVLESDELEEIGPSLLELITHVELRSRTGSFECRVGIQYKFEDGAWSEIQPADVVHGTVSVDGYPAPVVFADRSRLGRRRIRLVLQYHAAQTGGAVGNRALVRVSVACRPFCC